MKSILTINKSNRKWHFPVIAGISVGSPLLLGWYLNNIDAGKLGSLAGLSILYIHSDDFIERMINLIVCCFGILFCYTVGLLFSFNNFIAPIAFGILSFWVHYSLYKLNLTRPPGNFFFIMLAATAICTPFNIEKIPQKIGYVALGVIFTCFLGMIYGLLTLKEKKPILELRRKSNYTHIIESITFGVVMATSLVVAFIFGNENPYWVPISCLAVMQGRSTKHIWLRGSQRVLGTFVGLGLTWLFMSAHPSQLTMILSIAILQIIVEFLVVRNYGIAVVFITILTIFLSESGHQMSANINSIFITRMVDILVGSIIGILGGWILYHEKLHFFSTMKLRKSRVALHRLRKFRKY